MKRHGNPETLLFKFLLIVLGIGIAGAAGFYAGLQSTLPFPLTLSLHGPDLKSWVLREQWPPMAFTAQGTVIPLTGELSVDALAHSTDPIQALSVDLHIGGTVEKPQVKIRNLKKKNVRLQIRL